MVEVFDESALPAVADLAAFFEVPLKPYPWPTVTGTIEVQERPNLASRVSLWTGEETLTFFEKPSSQNYSDLLQASAESPFVTVRYRLHQVGESQVPTIIKVVTG